MFIYKGNAREIAVTAGTVIACCHLAATATGGFFHGGYLLIVSFICILILIAILKGIKLGYALALFFYGGTAILFIVGPINPFMYFDVGETTRKHYGLFVAENFAVAAVAAFLFYCLKGHAQLRGIK